MFTFVILGSENIVAVMMMQMESEQRRDVSSWVKEMDSPNWDRKRMKAVTKFPKIQSKIVGIQFGGATSEIVWLMNLNNRKKFIFCNILLHNIPVNLMLFIKHQFEIMKDH